MRRGMRKLSLLWDVSWSWRVLFAVAGSLILIVGLSIGTPPASAEFSRSFIPRLSLEGTPAGPFGEVQCIAIDTGEGADSSGNIWVGDATNGVVDEFNSSSEFLEQFGSPAHLCAFDYLDEKFYAVGAGESVAVDDSTGPYTGDIYFGSEGSETQPGSLSRETPNKEPVPFTCPAGISAGYISGSGALIGRPGENGGSAELWHGRNLGGVAIDSGNVAVVGEAATGDIYVIDNKDFRDEIEEFTPTGCFVRAITGNVQVTNGGKTETVELGFHLFLTGIAVDPTDGDVLVTSLEHSSHGSWAVDEFSSLGRYLGMIAGPKNEQFREGAFSGGGIAVNAVGDVYVSVHKKEEEKNVVDVFGPGAYYPDAVTGEVIDNRSTAVTMDGVVRGVANSEGKNLDLTKCEFEYVTEEAFKASGFSAAAVAPCLLESGSSPVGQRLEEKNYPVHAEATYLKPGNIYYYRLVATTDQSERGGTREGEVASVAAAARPAVEAVSVGNVSSSFADFHAKVNPLGSGTTYQFQYVDAAGYEAALAEHAVDPYAAGASVPVPAAGIGSGDGYVSVSARAAGLPPGTTYHYRMVASNGVGVTEGADNTFSTVPAGLQGLPDGRAYELVTPVNKGDAEDMFEGTHGGLPATPDVGYASEDGGHFLLLTDAAFGPFPASGEGAYVFSRGEDGWSFESVVSPTLANQTVTGLVFDPWDFSMVGVEDDATMVQGVRQLGLAGPPGGPYATVASGTKEKPAELAGASQDLSHLIVRSLDHDLALCESTQEGLAKGLDEGSNGLYEWSAEHQCLSLVDVRSKSEGGGLISRCGATLGLGGAPPGVGHGAVSADGSKVFFTAPDPGFEGRGELQGPGCWNGGTVHPPQLYMRLHGETTVEVSAPEGGGGSENPAMYVGAAEDGSRVFFMTKTELTSEARALKLHGLELYEYNTEAPVGERLVRVSRGDLESGPVEGKVLDVPAVSANGSTVYFNAEGDLTSEAHGGGLYRYDAKTGETTYVAPPQGYPDSHSASGVAGTEDPLGRWYEYEIVNRYVAGLDLEAGYYTTRDGQFLLSGPYRYDAANDSTVCVMCNPNGSGPIPDASFTRSHVGHANPAGGLPRAMSENGEYVFFDTAESLAVQDTNGKLDVYEWHEDPISHERTIALISSGEDPSNSYFLDSSSYVNTEGETVEGGNVFFGSHANLVPSQDTGSEGNLYDARIGGGYSASTGAAPCEAACQHPPPAQGDPTTTLVPQLVGTSNTLGAVKTVVKPHKKSKPKKKRKKAKARHTPTKHARKAQRAPDAASSGRAGK
jgi:hypothetical protein